MKAGIVAFTDKGFKLSAKLEEVLTEKGYEIFRPGPAQALRAWLSEAFKSCDAIFFISAAGIAVRAIAPFIDSKQTDPAILVVDHAGTFVISLLSGHIGGANSLAKYLAEELGAIPVITTATDLDGKIAIDEWAVKSGLLIDNIKLAKDIAMDILHNRPVGLISDIELGKVDPAFDIENPYACKTIVKITFKDEAFESGLKLVAKRLSVGVGCRRGLEGEKIQKFIEEVFSQKGLDMRAIENIASIDLKNNEQGIISTAEALGVPFITYSGQELMQAEGDFPSSAFVTSVTGVDNVCQRAAVLASGQGEVVVEKTSKDGITVSVSVRKDVLDVI